MKTIRFPFGDRAALTAALLSASFSFTSAQVVVLPATPQIGSSEPHYCDAACSPPCYHSLRRSTIQQPRLRRPHSEDIQLCASNWLPEPEAAGEWRECVGPSQRALVKRPACD